MIAAVEHQNFAPFGDFTRHAQREAVGIGAPDNGLDARAALAEAERAPAVEELAMAEPAAFAADPTGNLGIWLAGGNSAIVYDTTVDS